MTNLMNIPILVFLLLCPANVLGQKTEALHNVQMPQEGHFVLTVDNSRLSLLAQEASLKAILGDIGQKMGIEVVGEISPQEMITAEFHNLPLEQALHRLSPNYGYQVNSKSGDTAITKIFVLPKGRINGIAQSEPQPVGPQKNTGLPNAEQSLEAASSSENEKEEDEPQRPEPFKFEFDPSAFISN